jgi:hypothetical protein
MASSTLTTAPRPTQVARVDLNRLPVGPPTSARRVPTENEIRVVAYVKWASAGCPAGDWVAFWLAAELELNGHSL